ncbi:hypothetical protein EUGRSUZ_K02141 [Eucalyptus grandis]|uniref:Uncharacterized protein n=2 Tax=Eucalyptus grandis TaxID=71139 RepID=A0ACC3IYD0_EUCGR|nr:hypothetical protein EUGRSUZ_K02141 [Eucalyptus grandis]
MKFRSGLMEAALRLHKYIAMKQSLTTAISFQIYCFVTLFPSKRDLVLRAKGSRLPTERILSFSQVPFCADEIHFTDHTFS